MGAWKYEGYDSKKNRVKGTVEASTEKEVRKILRAQGIRPRMIAPPSILELDLNEWLVDRGFVPAFTFRDLLVFTRQLATLLDAGVPILQSLELLYKQTPNLALKKTIKKVASEVGGGKTFSDALEGKQGFDALYVNLIRAGEAAGIVDEILTKLAEFMEKQDKTKKQIKSAMTYPAIVTVVGTVVIWGLLKFIVPQFVDMIQETGQEVPWITQAVMNASKFLEDYSLIMIVAAGILLASLSRFIKTPAGKVVFDKFIMNLPIFGKIIIKGNLSQFMRTLSTMMSSGIGIVDALDISIKTTDNEIIKKDLRKVQRAVTTGKSLSEPLMSIEYFPEMVAQMVRVGESTGSIDQMLSKCSTVFEEDVNESVQGMGKLIEPIILVVLGGAVAVVLIAMYLPIFMSAGGAGQ